MLRSQNILSLNDHILQGEVTGSSERCVALLTALRSLLQVTSHFKYNPHEKDIFRTSCLP